ncbi:hypothetical protein [Altererythrobacter sp. ZODW24]|uniref:hypothetical protein n=1 Tax=Altererythrobacter sp. ZODW24 TaxID=2185142 RepID=UPI001F073F63|nr:hypothetical protein [Altererythrobacter sp. ZODW24]
MQLQQLLVPAAALLLASCQQGGEGDTSISGEAAQASSIGMDEKVQFGGNEPFWGGEVSGAALTYTTPENPDGTRITVSRRAGLGGISWSGEMDGEAFMLAVSELQCSDGMSGRTYSLTATLQLGSQPARQGCAWTESMPYSDIE